MDKKFELVSPYKLAGDQIKATDELVASFNDGKKQQTLLGVTGSGKTFTVANVIERIQKPTLVLAHNKILAAQLASEFREFFPNNAVEYFVSYYDYYQPEAYIPHTDTFIEKDSSINEEIDKLRHSATASLLERKDVIVVASVSCIYGLGDPEDYANLTLSLRSGSDVISRDDIIAKLVEMQYSRNDIALTRGTFRILGDRIDIFPASEGEKALRLEFFGDEIEKISEIEVLTGKSLGLRDHVLVFPNSHYVTTSSKMESAIENIELELEERLEELKANNKLVEEQRLRQRTKYDVEMMREIGFCSGIENYSRHISGREAGSAPFTLIDYFGDDFLLVIDESHVTIPQVRAMYNGDRARKENLVEYGFRLPSAFDNRPLKFPEFEKKVDKAIYVSATPNDYEKEKSDGEVVEQIIRPTGLVDPVIEIRPVEGQIEDLYGEINEIVAKKARVLVTTLTKKQAEDLTAYLENLGVKVRYMHSDVATLERMEIIRDLRLGVFDVLVGINLLREGLDLPEVELVAIIDADKEGFLRSETSMIQTIGRAARNSEGRVIMYADKITGSMERAINETNRRRELQIAYNSENNITPMTITKDVHEVIEATHKENMPKKKLNREEKKVRIIELEQEMYLCVENLQFERASEIRDELAELKR